ncbi:MAG TPA: aminotransferase class V-fold PLP-dependent enzyme, partial [Roseiflexaceae bacterium]|nr:aminotransferase class V-fold PLP-dependent enzyme [Roseiflexaceae bacterium]
MPTITPASMSALREQEFPITADYTYLNHATQGPLPTRTRQALDLAAQQAQWPGIMPDAPREFTYARPRLASLLGVGEDDLVFTPNTTYGLNVCAHGIEWRAGDNVVIPDREFPSLARTWLNLRAFGVEVRVVPWQGAGPTVDQLMQAVDRRTRVVSCSAVAWDTGFRVDLETLGRRCEAAGILLIVDGIQAVGAVQVDPAALRLSALSFHGYKWLLAGFGCGAMYVAPSAVEQIRPRFVGEQSYAGGEDDTIDATAWKAGAQRYTVGGMNMPGLTALAASLELLESVGLPAIERHNHELTAMLFEGLHALPAVELVTPREQCASIVVFTLG